MFCFITSVRSPAVSRNWPRVCELFERTALSVFNQTTPDFRLIAVCHDLPTLKIKFDERLEFIQASHRAPSPNHKEMIDDKVLKLLTAMRRVRELESDYVMPVDADDLLSHKVAAHVMSHPDVDGWYVDRGYSYQYGHKWLEQLPSFFRICGTCNILSRRWFRFPGAPEREIAADNALIVQGHDQSVEALGLMGAHLQPLPFAAAVYTVSNGDNSSRLDPSCENAPKHNRLRARIGGTRRAAIKLLNYRRCTAELRNEFALNPSAV